MRLLLRIILRYLVAIHRKEERIHMKLTELATALADMSTQLAKAQAEILNKIAELNEALTNVDVPADAVTALENLKTAAQGLDDIVPG